MRTIEDMVQQEIMCCMSSLVSTLAKAQGASYTKTGARFFDSLVKDATGDLSALIEQASELAAPVPDYEEAATQAGWIFDGRWFHPDHGGKAGLVYQTPDDLCSNQNIDPYDWEVYEHWAVSQWLAEKLIEQGEKVDTDFGALNVWARTTTGQAISMDGCIKRIYDAMMAPVEA